MTGNFGRMELVEVASVSILRSRKSKINTSSSARWKINVKEIARGWSTIMPIERVRENTHRLYPSEHEKTKNTSNHIQACQVKKRM